ncbi:MAG: hypothetical protein GX896_03225 [Clostridiales bacterium]|nr:hypothetical protein [Clostridiales bacterium]
MDELLFKFPYSNDDEEISTEPQTFNPIDKNRKKILIMTICCVFSFLNYAIWGLNVFMIISLCFIVLIYLSAKFSLSDDIVKDLEIEAYNNRIILTEYNYTTDRKTISTIFYDEILKCYMSADFSNLCIIFQNNAYSTCENFKLDGTSIPLRFTGIVNYSLKDISWQQYFFLFLVDEFDLFGPMSILWTQKVEHFLSA